MKTELREITRDNVSDAIRVEVKAGQSSFVAPVVYSLAEAYVQPDVAWPRLVYSDDQPVAFVMGACEPSAEIDFFRCGIWRLSVAADEQGKGYGRFAAEGVLDEAHRRGQDRATVLWVPGEGGPEGSGSVSGSNPPEKSSTGRQSAMSSPLGLV